MLEIWLLGLSYKKNGTRKELTIRSISTISFKNLFLINSKPLAIITATGKAAINNSDPSLLNVTRTNPTLIRRWIKSKLQLFLKLLLTDKALPVFIKIAKIANTERVINGIKNLFSKYKLKS
jgi:hypothetical protein